MVFALCHVPMFFISGDMRRGQFCIGIANNTHDFFVHNFFVIYTTSHFLITGMVTRSAAPCDFCTVPRGTVFHPRGRAAEILHRATIIDALSSGTREHSAHVRVSAEVYIKYYTGTCIADEGLSKNPGEEKPATGGNLAENHENRGETPEKHRDFESGPSSPRTSLAGLKRASSNIRIRLELAFVLATPRITSLRENRRTSNCSLRV